MATVVYGGDAEFSALAYGERHPNLVQFLTNQVESFSQNLNEQGKYLYERASTAFQAINNSDAVRLARAVRRKAQNIWDDGNIKPLTDIGQLQNAQLKMQRWIMAEPKVRRSYHDQRCDGYSDSYIDTNPNHIGESHYDYRRVMDGMLTTNAEGRDVINNYIDVVSVGDNLSIEEQADILVTWQSIREHMNRKKDDPTSPFNASL